MGYGFAHDLAATPVAVSGVTGGWAREIYWLAQQADQWPGGAYEGASPFYEGTSVLAGAKVVTDLEHYSGYTWALNAQEIAVGVGYKGPCILGLPWYQGMYATDTAGFIHRSGELIGGHCLLAIGVKIVWKSWINRFFSRKWDNVDYDRSYVTLHNSWGPSWGQNGRAKLSLSDLEALLAEQGDACFPERIVKIFT